MRSCNVIVRVEVSCVQIMYAYMYCTLHVCMLVLVGHTDGGAKGVPREICHRGNHQGDHGGGRGPQRGLQVHPRRGAECAVDQGHWHRGVQDYFPRGIRDRLPGPVRGFVVCLFTRLCEVMGS